VSAFTVSRFDRATRVVHWVTAADAALVLATATALYVPEISARVGRRAGLMEAHLISGLFLPVPLLFAMAAGPAGVRLRRDLTELSRWRAADRRWLRRRDRPMPEGKYNGGQKLVTALFAALFVMQLLSGSVMYWHDPFSAASRTGATFVHDWAYLALAAVVIGHVAKALQEPELMHAMRSGEVSPDWARRERPSWDHDADAAHDEASEPIVDDRGGLMWLRVIGGALACVVGAVWILQGLDIVTGSGMSGHAVWAVFGVILVGLGVVLLRAAVRTRSAR
jgi:formate dehydrogenase subunit gamma